MTNLVAFLCHSYLKAIQIPAPGGEEPNEINDSRQVHTPVFTIDGHDHDDPPDPLQEGWVPNTSPAIGSGGYVMVENVTRNDNSNLCSKQLQCNNSNTGGYVTLEDVTACTNAQNNAGGEYVPLAQITGNN